jgi:hypothetical protein
MKSPLAIVASAAMKSPLAIVASAVIAAGLVFTPLVSSAEYTIENLIEDTGVREGPTPMRDKKAWDARRSIVIRVIRDIGLDLPDFGGLNVVVARSVDEAMAKAGDAGAIIGYCDAELLAAAPHVSWVQIFSAGVERCFPSQKLSNGTVTLTNMQKMSSPVIVEWHRDTDEYAEDVVTGYRGARHCDDAGADKKPAGVQTGSGAPHSPTE